MRKAIVNSGLISSLIIPGHAPVQCVLRSFPSSDQGVSYTRSLKCGKDSPPYSYEYRTGNYSWFNMISRKQNASGNPSDSHN